MKSLQTVYHLLNISYDLININYKPSWYWFFLFNIKQNLIVQDKFHKHLFLSKKYYNY